MFFSWECARCTPAEKNAETLCSIPTPAEPAGGVGVRKEVAGHSVRLVVTLLLRTSEETGNQRLFSRCR